MSAQGLPAARDELETASERGSGVVKMVPPFPLDSKAYTVGAWIGICSPAAFSLCWCPETGLERSRADFSWPALSG